MARRSCGEIETGSRRVEPWCDLSARPGNQSEQAKECHEHQDVRVGGNVGEVSPERHSGQLMAEQAVGLSFDLADEEQPIEHCEDGRLSKGG
jgi:hypothetical protein